MYDNLSEQIIKAFMKVKCRHRRKETHQKQPPHHDCIDLRETQSFLRPNDILSRKVILILHVVAQLTLEQSIWPIIIALEANLCFFRVNWGLLPS